MREPRRLSGDAPALVFVGTKDIVLALDEQTGEQVWRQAIPGHVPGGILTLFWDGVSLLAATGGEVSRLDPRTGAVLWHNDLKGLGWGVVAFASMRAPSAASSGMHAAAAELQSRSGG
jgi:outer membrane protein assembly factor BamB